MRNEQECFTGYIPLQLLQKLAALTGENCPAQQLYEDDFPHNLMEINKNDCIAKNLIGLLSWKYKKKNKQNQAEIDILRAALEQIVTEIPDLKTYFGRNNVSITQYKWKKVLETATTALYKGTK